jgi:hypothetical protein
MGSGTAVRVSQATVRQPVNWGLLVCLLGCLSVWGAVVFAIFAAV